MRHLALLLGLGLATQANAGGIDVTGQPIGFIFNEGTVLELGYGHIAPTISGTDAIQFGGLGTGDIAPDFGFPYASFRTDITDRLAFGLVYDQSFGAEAEYGPGSVAFAGTTASASIASVTALLRYRVTDRISIHGGPRWQWGEADFLLQGAIYGPFAGYSATMENDSALGYVAGVSYEIPEYFIRVALTYNSAIEHEFLTTEVSGPTTLTSTVASETPQSWNFEFTAGVAEATFVFGGARWVDWSELQFAPPILSAASPDPLVDFNDTTSYALGVGRQFDENWTGLASVLYEPSTDPLTTPLTPTDGYWGASLGAIYTMGDLQIHANITATFLNDTTPFVNALGTTVSEFSDNRSLAAGLRLVQRF